jgi:hypothetical protein
VNDRLSGLRAALDGLSERRAAAIAALVTLTIGLATMTPDLIGVFFDDAIYVLVAKGIAEGQGYVYPQLPGTPPAIHYPPVWPGLLALVWKLGPSFPANLPLLKAINPVLLALAAFGGSIVAGRMLQLPAWMAAGAVLAATASIPMHVLTNVLLSEPIFIALLFPALWVAERARADGGWRLAVLAGLCGGLLVLTRTIAGAYVIATGLALLWERRWRETAVYGAVVAACIAPWQYFVWKHAPGFPDELRGTYGPYLEWLVDGYRAGGLPFLQDVVVKNVTDTWRFTGAVLTPRLAISPIRPLATAFGVLFTLVGTLVALRRGSSRILALGSLGYVGIVAVWPFQVDRFLWAVWPLLLLFALEGVRAAWRALRAHGRPRAALAVAAAGALLALGHTVYNVRGFSRGWANSASREMSTRVEGIVRYINHEERLRGKVIAAEAAPMVALYTGLQVVPVDMLLVEDHVRKKPPEQAAAIISAIDRRYTPEAYVMMPDGAHMQALLLAKFDSTRRFIEITPPGLKVRSFLSLPQ